MDFEQYKNKILTKDKALRKLYFDKNESFKIEVSNLITEARLYTGHTQVELAFKVGTKQSSIARLEQGKSLPSLSFLQKIAKALNTHLIAPRFGFMEEKIKNSTHLEKIEGTQVPYNIKSSVQTSYFNYDYHPVANTAQFEMS